MKKILILTLLILAFKNTRSQTFPWVKTAIGTPTATIGDEGIAVSTDPSGNIYVAGAIGSSTIAFGSYTLSNTGSREAFLTKYDPVGNVLWAKTAAGSGEDLYYSVSSDAAGNAYVIGSYFSTTLTIGSNTLINSDNTGNTSDICIAKYDPMGNVVWAKTIGGVKMDEGYSCTTDPAGNIYFTGNFLSSSVVFGTYTLTNPSSFSYAYDAYLVKYNPSGNVLWAKSYGSIALESGQAVNSNASGELVLTGHYRSPTLTFGTYTITNTGGTGGTSDVFVVKLDTSGVVLWANSLGGSSYDDIGYAVALDVSGNVFVTGFFGSTVLSVGTFTFANASASGTHDIFIAKYNSGGSVAWAKGGGGTGTDVGWGLTTDASGNCYATGGFNGSSITLGTNTLTAPSANCNPIIPSCDPAYIIAFDPGGTSICTTVLSSGGDDWLGITTDVIGNIFIAGDFVANPFTIGTYTLTRTGIEDVFVAKYLCSAAGIKSFDPIHKSVLIYPNPANTILTLHSDHNFGISKISIEDLNGKIFYETMTSDLNGFSIDLNNIPSGMFILKIAGNEVSIKKFIKD